MLDSFSAILLGVIQGITEFLPISSSGHLVIAQQTLQLNQNLLWFDIMVHVASLVAIIIFFKDTLRQLTLKKTKNIILGTVPAVIVGLLFQSHIEHAFQSLPLVAIALVVTGFLLVIAHRAHKGDNTWQSLGFKSVLIIGLFQSLALVPGISRSGATLTGSILVGLSLPQAFQFTFLLAIPAILGAFSLQLFSLEQSISLSPPILFGFMAAALTSLAALTLLKSVIKHHKLIWFAYYCFALGLSIIVLV